MCLRKLPLFVPPFYNDAFKRQRYAISYRDLYSSKCISIQIKLNSQEQNAQLSVCISLWHITAAVICRFCPQLVRHTADVTRPVIFFLYCLKETYSWFIKTFANHYSHKYCIRVWDGSVTEWFNILYSQKQCLLSIYEPNASHVLIVNVKRSLRHKPMLSEEAASKMRTK